MSTRENTRLIARGPLYFVEPDPGVYCMQIIDF